MSKKYNPGFIVKEVSESSYETVEMDNGDEYLRYSDDHWKKNYGCSIEEEHYDTERLEKAYQKFKAGKANG